MECGENEGERHIERERKRESISLGENEKAKRVNKRELKQDKMLYRLTTDNKKEK